MTGKQAETEMKKMITAPVLPGSFRRTSRFGPAIAEPGTRGSVGFLEFHDLYPA